MPDEHIISRSCDCIQNLRSGSLRKCVLFVYLFVSNLCVANSYQNLPEGFYFRDDDTGFYYHGIIQQVLNFKNVLVRFYSGKETVVAKYHCISAAKAKKRALEVNFIACT